MLIGVILCRKDDLTWKKEIARHMCFKEVAYKEGACCRKVAHKVGVHHRDNCIHSRSLNSMHTT